MLPVARRAASSRALEVLASAGVGGDALVNGVH
jgi:hypothetical protein